MLHRKIILKGPRFAGARSRLAKTGFTLLEILIAVAIIAVIVSMLYGSYFATARSTEAYDAAMEISGQARQALAQMARQIRCAYAPQSVHKVEQKQQASGMLGQSLPPEKLTLHNESLTEKVPNYFTGGVDGSAGEVLQFVTTVDSSVGLQLSNGLLEVVYRFDKSRRLLSSSRQRFVEKLEGAADRRDWQPVLAGVERLELTFYDGQNWLNKWDFRDKCRPPLAVKIDIICEDKNGRQYRWATTACVPCCRDQSRKTLSKTSTSSEEQWN